MKRANRGMLLVSGLWFISAIVEVLNQPRWALVITCVGGGVTFLALAFVRKSDSYSPPTDG